eukprot:692754-Prorocentrum_lima.AAC.1
MRKSRPGDTGDRALSPEDATEAAQGGSHVRDPSAATSGSEELPFRAHSRPPVMSTPAQKAA